MKQVPTGTCGIERVRRPAFRDFHEKYLKPGKPVLLDGMMEDWPALEKWTPGFFREIGGGRKVRIEFGNVLQEDPHFEEWDLGRYLDLLESLDTLGSSGKGMDSPGSLPYLAYFDIFKFFPELRKDVEFPFWRGRILFPIGWIGPAGSFTGLHWDIAPNLFAQIRGAKEFTLYPPQQTPFLYPSRKYDIGSILSSVDARMPDYDRFPLFRKAEGIKVEVQSGQILFTPRGWWHQVLGLETSISVSCFGFDYKDFLFRGIPGALKHGLHGMGLFRKGNCACHKAERAGSGHD
jgi:hypothetical protein